MSVDSSVDRCGQQCGSVWTGGQAANQAFPIPGEAIEDFEVTNVAPAVWAGRGGGNPIVNPGNMGSGLYTRIIWASKV